MIAVAIPSRGLMHSRTMDDVLRNCKGYDVEFVFSHGRPQPDAQNFITEEALKLNPKYIWFVDDDLQIPFDDVLTQLIHKLEDTAIDMAIAHYPCSPNGNTHLHIRDGIFESTGMGCVLVRPEIFEKLEKPYFRADTTYVWETDHLQPYPARPDKIYHGLYDVDWSQRLIKAGVKVAIIETKCGQYFTEAVRKFGNNSKHEVMTWRLP